MSDTTSVKGKCLCGAVTIEATSVKPRVGACHCHMCRRWGGGPLFCVNVGDEPVIAGEEHVKVFDSSPWAERGFCAECGSHLFYRVKQSRAHFVPVGLFEDKGAFVFDHQVFIDEKPAYYELANETQCLTGAEVFAMFAPSS